MGRRLILAMVLSVVLLTLVAPVFAQEATPASSSLVGSLVLTSIAMAIAAAGCGYAQSNALSAACEGVARNPGATDTIRIFTFLGLAFIEFLALLTFVVIMILVYR